MDEQGDGPLQAPQAWIDDLAQAEAEVAAGLTVDGTAVMQRLRESIDEMEQGTGNAADETVGR